MLRKSPHTKNLSTHGRCRAVLISSLLAIFLFSEGLPVHAAPAKSWVISTLVVSPSDNPLKVCEGEKVAFQVLIKRNEGTWSQLPYIGGRFTYPGALIKANSSDINAGFLTPASTHTTLSPTSAHNFASFAFKAKKKGTTTLRFVDTGGLNRPTASDVTVTIQVHECNYKLVVFSTWTLPDPFLKPHLISTFEAVLIPDQNGDIGPVSVPVENSAQHTQGMPFCSHPVVPENNEATITGYVDQDLDTLDLSINYDLMTATTTYTCTTPVGSFTVPNTGPGEVFVLDPQPIHITTGLGTTVFSAPHIIRAVSDVTGTSVIAIVPIFLP